ncbi:MAG TPA: type I pullulanase [Candidatus Nanopelagicaceae bacterium]|nr:type I pullulanase [Candidatus Nanopelagicaceae bacterium]
MKKIFSAFLATFALLLSGVPALAAPDSIKLTVHYQRPAGDYNGWNLWIWKNSDNNSLDTPVSQTGVPFTGNDDFGKVVTIDIDGMKNFKDIGIIVRLNDWVAKDINDDRFITEFDANGNAEVWLVQNDKTIYTKKPTIEMKISSAAFETSNEVKVELNKRFKPLAGSSNGFTISGGLNVISARTENPNLPEDTELILTLNGAISITERYKISHSTYGSVDIGLGNLISSEEFEKKFTYKGDDLGNTYRKDSTSFRLWAPTATKVELLTFSSPTSGVKSKYLMKSDLQGTWVYTLDGNHDGLIYTYNVEVYGAENEAVDPYARAAIANGKRSVVVNLESTNPKDWSTDKPKFSGKPTDAVIYELHIRDLSMDKSAPFPKSARGKFAGLTYSNLKGSKGEPVGIAAIKDLGITHLQLLPIYDFASVDELKPTFNWGYDPLNYNIPEGSYSSDPSNPKARITELKAAIQSLHTQGIRVIMDVVYNHVFDAATFSQSKIVPGYWFRTDPDGRLTSASGCGNDSASERAMVRKFIIDSVKYWATEYNISGFRFDLMGLHDIETMQQVRKELTAIDPTIIIIGEGWNMGTHPSEIRSNQRNIENLDGIAVFNDQIRDGIKGSVFTASDKGFATGIYGKKNGVQAGIVGNTDFSSTILPAFTTLSPGQSVNYVEAHDNNTLEDKLRLSLSTKNDSTIAAYHRLASSIPILAQGIPFIHAGQEFQRSKGGDSNSYQSGDEINSLKWNLITKNATTRNYFKGLLKLRAEHPAFRISTTADLKSHFKFLKAPSEVIAYSINGNALNDSWGTIVVLHNAKTANVKISLPAKADWKVVVEGSKAGTTIIRSLKSSDSLEIKALSTMVLYSK